MTDELAAKAPLEGTVNQAQRRRSAALAVALALLGLLGAASRLPGRGSPPEPCPRPALRGDLLVCDGAGAPPGARAWLVGAKLDLNQASARELQRISGIGASMAARIVEARTEKGGFRSLEELDEVKGIGPKTIEKLRAFLEVRAPAP
jgi:competence protein ComEA